MGRHKLWRAQVKKLRRKRLRQKKAQERDTLLEAARKRQEQSPTYQAWLEEQEVLEQFREEEEARVMEEMHIEWERAEIEAQQAWCLRQERAEKAKKEREEQELRIRKEWEEEQRKIKLQEEEKRKEQEEKQKKQDELMKEIINFVERGGERPLFANNITETNPNMPLCPFFTKTGACRFGDRCSRNHPRPALSKVVLMPNFYSHFGMDQSMLDEYDSDLLLEYEDSETYQHFREFYDDIVPELYRYGQPVAVVVCCNSEQHLRGNVYVEYGREAESAKAVTSLNGRWYGGKVISAQFTNIPSWKAAICGLFPRGRCPKGKTCNFLHIFRNPGGEFSHPDREREKVARRQRIQEERTEGRDRDFSERSSHRQEGRRGSQRSRDHSKREWRWSESPERTAYPAESEEKEGRSPEGERRERRRHKRRRDGKADEDEKKERKESSRSQEGGRTEGRHSSSRERHSHTKETLYGKDKGSSKDRSNGGSVRRSRHRKKRRDSDSGNDKPNRKSDRDRTKNESECAEERDHLTKDHVGYGGEASSLDSRQKSALHESSNPREMAVTSATPNGRNFD